MKVKVSEASGRVLDWMVALAEGATNLCYDTVCCWWFTLEGKDRVLSSGWSESQNWNPSTNWEQGGPIIERIEGLLFKSWLESKSETKCEAHIHNYDGDWVAFGPTPLVAALRCYVTSKLGDEVQVTDKLCA